MKKWYFIALLLLSSIDSFTQNACFTYNKGYGQFLYQNYQEAVTLFSQAIAEKPDLADAYANRGVSYHRLGQFDKAIADFIKDNTYKKERSSYNLACAYALQGKKDEAFKFLEAYQRSEYKQLISTLEKDKDFESLKSDSRWAKLMAADFFTPCDRAMIEANEKYDAKDYEGSLKACDKAIAAEKNDKRGYVSKGYIYTVMGKLEDALEWYDKLLKIDANDYEGYAGKGNVLYQQKKYAEALSFYEKAISVNPCYMAYYETGFCKYAINKKEEGVSDMKKYCEVFPNDDITVYTCGKLLYDMQRDDEAMVYAEKAIALNKETPEYFLLRAYVYQVKKKWDSAISDYTQVITLDSRGKGEAYYKRGICKAERFAALKNDVDKKGFCSDMEMADGLGITEAAQYLRELCD